MGRRAVISDTVAVEPVGLDAAPVPAPVYRSEIHQKNILNITLTLNGPGTTWAWILHTVDFWCLGLTTITFHARGGL
jgi:hypothetical protein